jgi:hypothetical protein
MKKTTVHQIIRTYGSDANHKHSRAGNNSEIDKHSFHETKYQCIEKVRRHK